MDEIAQELGFKDNAEMVNMICEVDLTHKATLVAFLAWKHVDGSKKGLKHVLQLKRG